MLEWGQKGKRRCRSLGAERESVCVPVCVPLCVSLCVCVCVMQEERVCVGEELQAECVCVCARVHAHHAGSQYLKAHSMPDLLMPPSPEISGPRKPPNPASSLRLYTTATATALPAEPPLDTLLPRLPHKRAVCLRWWSPGTLPST